jgi:hypothetical protein
LLVRPHHHQITPLRHLDRPAARPAPATAWR